MARTEPTLDLEAISSSGYAKYIDDAKGCVVSAFEHTLCGKIPKHIMEMIVASIYEAGVVAGGIQMLAHMGKSLDDGDMDMLGKAAGHLGKAEGLVRGVIRTHLNDCHLAEQGEITPGEAYTRIYGARHKFFLEDTQ